MAPRGSIRKQSSDPVVRSLLFILTLITAVAGTPGRAAAQVCSQMWDTITVSPSSVMVGTLSNYTISTHVPNSMGCAVSTLTVITMTLPGDTLADSITTGTLNGVAISFTTKNMQSVVFASPV